MTAPLLRPDADPAPVAWVNRGAVSPILLVCEHAGRAVPQALNGLGLTADQLSLHIGWDPGAAAVTRAMAQRLDCPAVLQAYSRLVIDCNRPPAAPDAMPETSDGVTIPGNAGLSPADRAARTREIFDPFHAAVTAARTHGPQILLSIHSFTPRLMSRGGPRPWHIGFLGRRDMATSERLMAGVRRLRPGLSVALNEPYQIDDLSDWFVPRHGEPSGLPHSLIEVRNDLIGDAAGADEIAALLCRAVEPLLENAC
ncbi:N-formylglutamate amidohydrolase [Chachezhania sediminis]|uniref:N-formylglutamate amidohydrolase n=1 Tax=Chachezhania sediminis TaxID=2599291 RepID=UPI00131CBC76|nr:N-formylglutamate amidohydrolase [Chachezhania sediminis]